LPYLLSAIEIVCVQGNHCVFGKVVNGMDVVKAIESVGSQSGATSQDVEIADCGEL
jgi:cyclophilin family peptidyl-prolyl cis-trans isomerase